MTNLKRISQKKTSVFCGWFPCRISLWVPRSKGEEALKILAEGAEQQVAGSPWDTQRNSAVIFHDTNSFSETWLFGTLEVSSIPQVVSCIIDDWLICMTLLHKSLLQAEKHSPEGKQ